MSSFVPAVCRGIAFGIAKAINCLLQQMVGVGQPEDTVAITERTFAQKPHGGKGLAAARR
jgi:hypothetical protein